MHAYLRLGKRNEGLGSTMRLGKRGGDFSSSIRLGKRYLNEIGRMGKRDQQLNEGSTHHVNTRGPMADQRFGKRAGRQYSDISTSESDIANLMSQLSSYLSYKSHSATTAGSSEENKRSESMLDDQLDNIVRL